MFEASERARLCDQLIERARADPAIVGAAIVGSMARAEQDPWSDVDLMLQLAAGVHEPAVVDEWTAWLMRHGLVDTTDVWAGDVRYRVHLLASSLQIDLSFWPRDRFRSTPVGFRLVFGSVSPREDPVAAPDRDTIIGLGWLYLLHARSATARGRRWQAVQMLDSLRDRVVELACLRLGLEAHHGRGVDRATPEFLEMLAAARSAGLDRSSLNTSRRRLAAILLAEVECHDPGRADRLRPLLAELSTEV